MRTKHKKYIVLVYFLLFFLVFYFALTLLCESCWQSRFYNPFLFAFIFAIALTYIIFLITHESGFFCWMKDKIKQDEISREIRFIEKDVKDADKRVIRLEKCVSEDSKKIKKKNRNARKKR